MHILPAPVQMKYFCYHKASHNRPNNSVCSLSERMISMYASQPHLKPITVKNVCLKSIKLKSVIHFINEVSQAAK